MFLKKWGLNTSHENVAEKIVRCDSKWTSSPHESRQIYALIRKEPRESGESYIYLCKWTVFNMNLFSLALFSVAASTLLSWCQIHSTRLNRNLSRKALDGFTREGSFRNIKFWPAFRWHKMTLSQSDIVHCQKCLNLLWAGWVPPFCLGWGGGGVSLHCLFLHTTLKICHVGPENTGLCTCACSYTELRVTVGGTLLSHLCELVNMGLSGVIESHWTNVGEPTSSTSRFMLNTSAL